MRLIMRGISFVYIYYRLYVLFLPTLLASAFGIRLFSGFKKFGIRKSVFIIMTLFSLDGILCYGVYRLPLLHEDIVISESEMDLSTITGISSSHVFYTESEFREDHVNGNVTIQMPVGKYRSVYFLNGTETWEYELEDSPINKILTECIVKIMLLFAVGFIMAFLVIRVMSFSFAGIRLFFSENIFGILVFFFLMMQFVFGRADQLDSWSSCWYAADYSMGMGSRFFAGSLLSLFYDDFLSQELAYNFCAAALVMLIVCVAYLINYAVKRTEAPATGAVKFLVICFLCCPGSVAALWTEGQMGRLEMYTLLLSLVGVIIFHKTAHRGVRYFSVTIIAVVSMAIYQGYLFLYFPILAVVIICDIFRDRKINIKSCICGFLSCMAVGISFLWFQFCSYVKYADATSMVAALSGKTDLYVESDAVYYECFATVIDAYKDMNTSFFLANGEFPREKLFLTIFLLAPIFVLVLAVYWKCLLCVRNKNEKIMKTPYLYCAFVNLAVMPQFVLNVDWGRWLTALVINAFFGILYLSYLEFTEMKKALGVLGNYVEQHKETAVFCILYLASLGKFGARNFLPQVDMLWKMFCRQLY